MFKHGSEEGTCNETKSMGTNLCTQVCHVLFDGLSAGWQAPGTKVLFHRLFHPPVNVHPTFNGSKGLQEGRGCRSETRAAKVAKLWVLNLLSLERRKSLAAPSRLKRGQVHLKGVKGPKDHLSPLWHEVSVTARYQFVGFILVGPEEGRIPCSQQKFPSSPPQSQVCKIKMSFFVKGWRVEPIKARIKPKASRFWYNSPLQNVIFV